MKGHDVPLFFMTQQTTWTSSDPKIKDWQWMLHRGGVTYREEHMHQALESYNDIMRGIASAMSIPTYDLARFLPKSSDHFYDDVHFNVNRARAAREALPGLFIYQRHLSGLAWSHTPSPAPEAWSIGTQVKLCVSRIASPLSQTAGKPKIIVNSSKILPQPEGSET